MKIEINPITPIYHPINAKYWTAFFKRDRLWYPASFDAQLVSELRPMPLAVVSPQTPETDPLRTAENVAHRLNVSTDWVWDHSSLRVPLLPVRISAGALRDLQDQIGQLGIPKLTFQAIRCTIATLARTKGTSRTFKGYCAIRGWPPRPMSSTKV